MEQTKERKPEVDYFSAKLVGTKRTDGKVIFVIQYNRNDDIGIGHKTVEIEETEFNLRMNELEKKIQEIMERWKLHQFSDVDVSRYAVYSSQYNIMQSIKKQSDKEK